MTTTTFATTTNAPAARPAQYSHRTFRELGYICTSLVTAIIGFTWVITLFSFGAGTLVTVLGLPVLALLLAGARGLGRLELDRVNRQLGLRLAAPAPVAVPEGAGLWGRTAARLLDGAGWRAAGYQVLMFPWQVFSFCVAVTLWSTGLALATLPAWNWVFPTYVGWPGYRLFDYTDAHQVHHAYYIATFWQVTRASLAGIGLLFVAFWATRLLTGVSRGAARALLADWSS